MWKGVLIVGYRSEVAYKIAFNNKEDFWGFIAEAKLDPETSLCWSKEGWNGDEFEVDEEQREIRFLAENVKWYSDYEDVKCHENLWAKAEARCDEEQIEVSGAYARVGEEPDDNEEKFFGDDPYEFVHISRQVIVDWM
jgi:hypothetical protein